MQDAAVIRPRLYRGRLCWAVTVGRREGSRRPQFTGGGRGAVRPDPPMRLFHNRCAGGGAEQRGGYAGASSPNDRKEGRTRERTPYKGEARHRHEVYRRLETAGCLHVGGSMTWW